MSSCVISRDSPFTYVGAVSGVVDKIAYRSYTHEAEYSVVDVDTGGTVTVEYTVDGDIHEHQVVSLYGSYAVDVPVCYVTRG